MNLAIVVISSDNQIHIKVLHTILQLNAIVNNSQISCNIHFCDNDPVSKANIFRDCTTGNFEKTIWLETDTHVDVLALVDILNNHIHEDLIVFPNMDTKVDWDQFTTFTKEATESTEPVSMRAITTDLKFRRNNEKEPGKLISIDRSDLRAFVMSNKKVNRKLKNKFKNTKYFYSSREHDGDMLSPPHNLCRMMKAAGVQMKALVDTNVTRYFKHEHIGSIKDTFGTHIRERQLPPVL